MRRQLGYPLYVNGKLFPEPVTISHVPGVGAVDPSMGALGQYVAYAPTLPPLGADEVLPGSTSASLAPPPPRPVSEQAAGSSTFLKVWSYLALPSALACAYHGYKRNDSVGWALWWGLVGGMPITPIIALAQGFGKRKGMTPNRRRNGSRTMARVNIARAGRTAKERGEGAVDSFNREFEFKVGDWAQEGGYDRDQAWKIYYDAFKKVEYRPKSWRGNADFDSEKFFREYDWKGGTASELNKLDYEKRKKQKRAQRSKRRRR